LGELRATEAIDVLLRFVAYPRPAEIMDSFRLDNRIVLDVDGRPAIEPLVKIGEACIDPILAKLKTTDNDSERLACVTVLARLGTRSASAKVGIRARLVHETETATGAEQEALRRALASFDRWLPLKERVERDTKLLREAVRRRLPVPHGSGSPQP
jgi:hypothetical protein